MAATVFRTREDRPGPSRAVFDTSDNVGDMEECDSRAVYVNSSTTPGASVTQNSTCRQ